MSCKQYGPKSRKQCWSLEQLHTDLSALGFEGRMNLETAVAPARAYVFSAFWQESSMGFEQHVARLRNDIRWQADRCPPRRSNDAREPGKRAILPEAWSPNR